MIFNILSFGIVCIVIFNVYTFSIEKADEFIKNL